MTADVSNITAVISMGRVGEESINRLKTHVASIEIIRIRAPWKPNAVVLKTRRDHDGWQDQNQRNAFDIVETENMRS